jgi:glucokinase
MTQIYATWQREAGTSHKTVDLSAEVSKRAIGGSEALCHQAMRLFLEAYGAEAGNLALKLLPFGGLYVAGGIASKIVPLIDEGYFMKTFRDKGRMGHLMAQFPVNVVLNPKVGLIGAAIHAAQL